MEGCTLCPRLCGADRAHGARGFCGADATLRVARAALHRWEEPCISVGAGSGAVFFCGCSLRCVYCQNAEISQTPAGTAIDEGRLYDILFALKAQGAANINLVTPTQYADVLARVLRRARWDGLELPVVYNCGGYERVETLRMLQGLIDVYLPDFKYLDADLAARCSGAADYPAVAKAALCEMVRQRPVPCFDGARMVAGVLVRHLVLPGHVQNSLDVLSYLADTYGDDIYISIMRQYTPPARLAHLADLGRAVSAQEYARVLARARQLGITCGYTQEEGSIAESFIPAFDATGVIAPPLRAADARGTIHRE